MATGLLARVTLSDLLTHYKSKHDETRKERRQRAREERRGKTFYMKRIERERADRARLIAAGKPWFGADPVKAEDISLYTNVTKRARTQKARGVGLLEYLMGCHGGGWFRGAADFGRSYLHMATDGGLSWLNNKARPVLMTDHAFPRFARPCPQVPRHGFVDSRLIKDEAELKALHAEVLAADPEGEILLGPAFEEVRSSFVATPAGVTWGKSNDGATGNTSATLTIPAPGTRVDVLAALTKPRAYTYIAALADAIVPHDPYIEGIVSRDFADLKTYLVQLRDGPEQPRTKHYIPRDYQWTHTITPAEGEDLLAWERRILDVPLAEREETVVWIPNGALASHYAVHAIASGIAVYTGASSLEGQKLVNSGPAVGFGYSARVALAQRVGELFKRPLWSGTYNFARLITACATIQSYGTWDGTQPHLRELLAHALVDLFRYGAAACIGEARHFGGKASASEPVFPARLWSENDMYFMRNETWASRGLGEADRAYIYDEAMTEGLLPLLRALAMAKLDFDIPWTRSGFGGRAWADCTAATIELGQALRMMQEDADTFNGGETWMGRACKAANVLVNMQHNGGCLYNKWNLTEEHLTTITEWPGLGFVTPICGEIVLRTLDEGYTTHGLTFDGKSHL